MSRQLYTKAPTQHLTSSFMGGLGGPGNPPYDPSTLRLRSAYVPPTFHGGL